MREPQAKSIACRRTSSPLALAVERICADLERRGIVYPEAWEGAVFTHRKGEELVQAAELLRATLAAADGDQDSGGP